MNTIIAIFVVVIFFIPVLVISLISAVILNVVIAYTGTDYFDCWLIAREYCYEEGGVYYIPESPIKPSAGYRNWD